MTFIEAMQAYGIGIISALAFIVSLIVEITKNFSVLKKVPTDAYTIVLSIIFTSISYFVAIDLLKSTFVWYEFIFAILAGFPVAYIAMFGWEKIRELWGRFSK